MRWQRHLTHSSLFAVSHTHPQHANARYRKQKDETGPYSGTKRLSHPSQWQDGIQKLCSRLEPVCSRSSAPSPAQSTTDDIDLVAVADMLYSLALSLPRYVRDSTTHSTTKKRTEAEDSAWVMMAVDSQGYMYQVPKVKSVCMIHMSMLTLSPLLYL